MKLGESTRFQLPVLEVTLRRWRLSNVANLEPNSTHRRRIEREAARLLSLVTVLREEMSRSGERLNAVNAVLPFIEVARSPVAGTETKSVAVESLYRIVDSMSPGDDGALEALSAVTEAVLDCRFEQTDSGTDEVAMMWLLETLSKCSNIRGVGVLLNDEVLFRVMETLFDGCTVPFNSDTTRAIAMKLITQFIRDLFSVASFGSTSPSSEFVNDSPSPLDSDLKVKHDVNVPTAATTLAARKTFQFLVEMADPEQIQHAQVIGTWGRFVALRMLVEATMATVTNEEVRLMSDESIASVIRNDLMRTLIQTAQTVGSSFVSPAALEDPNRMIIISEALRLANILLGHRMSRRELTTQFECFYNSVYARALEKSAMRKFVRADEAVLVIESLLDLLADPGVLCDCYVAFDLHLQSTDLFENTFKLFSRLAFPHQLSVPALDSFRLLSLRGLLVSLRALTAGTDAVGAGGQQEPSTAEEEESVVRTWKEEEKHAKELKARKAALHRCAEAFNSKPKQGIQALKEEGVLSDPPDPLVLASFLRNTPTLDKVAIGQFLGESDELNRTVLRSYTETFDVRNRTLVSSLRTFLECFRLPKEAQQIDRVVQVFADVAMAQCTDASYFPTVDACYILCFAIIMLNTDLHNPNIRPEKKMTPQQFINTNRNYGAEVSKGVDLPSEFLASIYEDIAKREINTMKEGSGITAEISRDRWHDLLARAREAKLGSATASSSQSQHHLLGYKKCMFEAIWRPALAAVSVVFDSGQASEQPDALHSALDGFLTLAKASARFDSSDAFDSVVAALCKFTSLLTYGSTQVDLVENTRAFSNALREFGNHHKGQMAAMSVFALARRFGGKMRRSWRHVLWCILRMSDLKLLPDEFRNETLGALDSSARSLFHRKIRDFVLKQQVVDSPARRSSTTRGLTNGDSSSMSSSSTGTGGGWGFTAWLFGGDEEDGKSAMQQRLETDDEYRALMSALRVADSFASLERRTSPGLGSPKGSANNLPSPTGSSSPKPHHSHHHKFLESSDMLEVGDAEDIFSRVDENVIPSAQYASECVKSCRPFSLFADARNLPEEALQCLVDALFTALGMAVQDREDDADESSKDTHAGGGGGKSKEDFELSIEALSPPSSGSKLVAIHLLAEIVLRCPSRFSSLFPRVSEGLFELLRTADGPSLHVELACVALTRIALGSFAHAPGQLVLVFHRLIEFVSRAPGLEFLVGRTVLDLVSRHPPIDPAETFWSQFTRNNEVALEPLCGWGEFFSLVECLASASHVSVAFGFDTLKFAVSLPGALASAKSSVLVDGARSAAAFALVKWPAAEHTARESAALDMVFAILEMSSRRANDTYVSDVLIPILAEFLRIAQDDAVGLATKKKAFALVQRACLNTSSIVMADTKDSDWLAVLESIVFPACSNALREGESGPSSPLVRGGEAKLMMAACELLAKFVLAFAGQIAKLERFSELWVEVLQFFERFKRAGLIRAASGESDGNELSETVTELVKNLLLSLSAQGILSPTARTVATGLPLTTEDVIPPPNAPASLLWEMSWAVLERSQGLRADLFALDDTIDLRETPVKDILNSETENMASLQGASDLRDQQQTQEEEGIAMEDEISPDQVQDIQDSSADEAQNTTMGSPSDASLRAHLDADQQDPTVDQERDGDEVLDKNQEEEDIERSEEEEAAEGQLEVASESHVESEAAGDQADEEVAEDGEGGKLEGLIQAERADEVGFDEDDREDGVLVSTEDALHDPDVEAEEEDDDESVPEPPPLKIKSEKKD